MTLGAGACTGLGNGDGGTGIFSWGLATGCGTGRGVGRGVGRGTGFGCTFGLGVGGNGLGGAGGTRLMVTGALMAAGGGVCVALCQISTATKADSMAAAITSALRLPLPLGALTKVPSGRKSADIMTRVWRQGRLR